MCMINEEYDNVTMLGEAAPVARQEHKCRECFRVILAGERYHVDRFVWEGSLDTFKTCAHCMVARDWLGDECGGWLFSSVEEDIREHAHSGKYPIDVIRIAVGMAWKWRAPSGRLLPIPKRPQTKHERLTGVTQ